jgi:hypothetical protein
MRVRAAATLHPARLYIFDLLAAEERDPSGAAPQPEKSRNNLRHASLTTTSLYLHIDDDRRHRETEDKHRIDW